MDRMSRARLDDTAYRGRFQTSRSDYSRPISRSSVDGFLIARQNPKSTQLSASTIIEKTLPTASRTDNKNFNKQNISTTKIPHHHLPKQLPSETISRQTTKKTPKFLRFMHGRPLTPIALSGMAVLLFSFGIFVAFSTLQTNKTALAQVNGITTGVQNNSSDDGVPSEDEPPGDLSSYSVAPDMPKILKIDKLKVNARIRRLGVTQSNVLKAPSNIFDVGWYEASAKPDENGAMVLDGHVSGPTKKGVFYKLGTLKPGDKITVVRGDNQEFTYTVMETKEYDSDKVDMPKVLTTSVAGKKGLNLISCTGKFNAQTNSFQKRVVVFTTQD